ncbi:Vascular endothelial growth factor receptor 3 [Labeo rohita]|uniref:Vascular endothelial growth factor receptor 3 n=1 Tax=Labeo rohita TaxID=84645 RepID=A0ABQ8L9V1_LABRO|nr:Vascular endothelial growth factor receptor 3 [Labeo rohita]
MWTAPFTAQNSSSGTSSFTTHDSHSGLAQPCSRRAVVSWAPQIMETPSPRLHIWSLDGTRRSGTCSSSGVPLTERTPEDARSESCSPFCSKGWSEGCLPAIAVQHDPIEGKSVGKHDLVIRFLRGARRLNLLRPPSVPSWDLSLMLTVLRQAPFEPLQSVELKFHSMKTLLLLALASIKRIGDLHTFSDDESCLEFRPADFQIPLRPRPGYVSKVPPTPFRDQVMSLQALPPEKKTQTQP